MSAEDDTTPLDVTDPFTPTALDEATELRALVRALEFGDGFSLLFARCNQPDQRRRLITALRSKLPRKNIQEVNLREPVPHLLDALRERLSAPTPDAVFVSGLEHSLPIAADAATTPFVANLNAARNSFGQVVPCPLVLWVPEYVLTAIARGAPDFFSIRSGVYYFAAALPETIGLAEALMANALPSLDSLPLADKQQRIHAIENLLADYEALPATQRSRYTEAQLRNRLAQLYITMRQWEKARRALEDILRFCRETGDTLCEGQMLSNLALIYMQQGCIAEAEAAVQTSLEAERKHGDYKGEARRLNDLGELYRRQGRLEEAEEYFRHSLGIHLKFGDLIDQATEFNNLGLVYSQRGEWSEAEALIEEAVSLCRRIHDTNREGRSLGNLAYVYEQQGRFAEAEAALLTSLEIARYLGDRVAEGRVLYNLAALQADQQDMTQALALGQQALATLATTEDFVEMEKVRQKVEAWERQATPPVNSERIAIGTA